MTVNPRPTISRSFKAALFVSGTLQFFQPIGVARAATLTLTESGRLNLHVYGENLSFREKDAPRIDVFANGCGVAKFSKSTMTKWLTDSAVARCLSNVFPDHKTKNPDQRPENGIGIELTIIPVNEEGRVYPGGIAASLVPESSLGTRSIIVGLAGGDQSARCDRPIVGGPDRQGYLKRPGGRSPLLFDEYSLPATNRLGHASRPLCVICLAEPSGDHRCAIHLDSKGGFASLALYWRIEDFSGPEPIWTTYDVAARSIAKSIFIDRSEGDLQ